MRTLLIFLAGVIMFSSCNKDEEKDIHSDLILEFGTVCGWCGGSSRMTIIGNSVHYLRSIPCGEDQGTIGKSTEISNSELNNILESYDYDHFLSLDLNTCNICADGCDEWIEISINGVTHKITYTPGNTIDGMEDLRELLHNLMDSFN